MDKNKAIIIQQAYGDYETLLDTCEAHHQAYADKWGMTYWPVRTRSFEAVTVSHDRHPNWDCILLIEYALAAGYEYVFWLDSDAVIWDTSVDLRSALPKGKDIGMVYEDRSDARQGAGSRKGQHFFNAGVLYLKSSPRLKQFFREVWSVYPHEITQYEQGAMNSLLGSIEDRFEMLDACWNYCPRIISPGRPPVVVAYHGDNLFERQERMEIAVASSVALASPYHARDPLLNVQIAVHGGYEDIFTCVMHLLANTHSPSRINLWDNGSDGATGKLLDFLTERIPQVYLTRMYTNMGFSAAHNRMVRIPDEPQCPVVCFLNSDALVDHAWDKEAVQMLLRNPSLGAAGPCAKMEHGTAYLEGSCLLMRTAVAAEFGPFDTENYPFAYYEDTDLCARLTMAGYRLAKVPSIRVRHVSGSPTLRRVAANFAGGSGTDAVGYMVRNRQTFRTRWKPHAQPAEIVVRSFGAIGDTLCCTPMFAAVRQQNPKARIIAETHSPAALLGNTDIDGVRNLSWWQDGSINVSLRYEEQRNPLPPTRIDDGREGVNIVDMFAMLAGVQLTAGRHLRLNLYDCEQQWAKEAMPPEFIAVACHSSWRTKNWPRLHQFLPMLAEASPLPIVLIGLGASALLPPLGEGVSIHPGAWGMAPHEWRERVMEWPGGNYPALLEAASKGRIIDLRSRLRMRQAFSVVQRARLLIAPDTSFIHAAAAFGVPSVSVHGPVEAKAVTHEGQVTISTPLACGGCYQRHRFVIHLDEHDTCVRERDRDFGRGYNPIIEGAECMAAIEPSVVLAACLERLVR